jgi:peptidase C13-like protein
VSLFRVALAAALLLVPRIAAAQDSHLLVITGVAGDEELSKTFHTWATSMIDAARKKDGLTDKNIVYLSEKPALDPAHIKARSTKENVEKAFADLAATARPNDAVFVILIGHGSFDGEQAAFNLPGPDLTAADFSRLLGKLATQRVAFVNTASSSGAFLPAVAGPNRVIVTATKTGGERNDTRFPEYFVEAFNDDSADRDRNGRVSIAEAFEYAKAKVVKAFEQQGLLLTEHAALEDGANGGLASSLFLAPTQASLNVDTSDPAMKALVDARDAIEKEIAALKLMKPSMDPGKYDAQMEKLLTDLALKTKEIRDRQGKRE